MWCGVLFYVWDVMCVRRRRCVCIFACVLVCVCVFVCVCACVSVWASVHACKSVHVRVCAWGHGSVRDLCAKACACVCSCM